MKKDLEFTKRRLFVSPYFGEQKFNTIFKPQI